MPQTWCHGSYPVWAEKLENEGPGPKDVSYVEWGGGSCASNCTEHNGDPFCFIIRIHNNLINDSTKEGLKKIFYSFSFPHNSAN